MNYKDLTYQKSSFSANYRPTCVGVAKLKEKVLVTNTNTKTSVVEFATDEWDAFIKGVKAGEFDSYAT